MSPNDGELDGERLMQQQLAWLLNVDVRTLRRWETEHRDKMGFPRNRDGTYHFQAVMWFLAANKNIRIGNRR
jgi:hypothetical protein